MTTEEFREKLPDITVRMLDGRIISGEVRGRHLDFAIVQPYITTGLHTRTVYAEFQAAWDTLAKCYAANKPLIA